MTTKQAAPKPPGTTTTAPDESPVATPDESPVVTSDEGPVVTSDEGPAVTVPEPVSAVVFALAWAATKTTTAAGLAAHLATAAAVLKSLLGSATSVAPQAATTLQDAWAEATERLAKDADPMSSSERRAVAELRGWGSKAWAVLDELIGRPASDAGEDGQK
jgi:hypothetical protein